MRMHVLLVHSCAYSFCDVPIYDRCGDDDIVQYFNIINFKRVHAFISNSQGWVSIHRVHKRLQPVLLAQCCYYRIGWSIHTSLLLIGVDLLSTDCFGMFIFSLTKEQQLHFFPPSPVTLTQTFIAFGSAPPIPSLKLLPFFSFISC